MNRYLTVLLKSQSLWLYLVYIFFFVFVGTFLFWRSVRRKSISLEKHFPADRVFDLLTLALVFSFLLGRLLVIFAKPNLFQDARWFWIPYEKISGKVYLFASFPWLFFNLRRGGFLPEGILLGMFTSILFFPRILSMHWIVISNAIVDFCWQFALGVLFFLAITSGGGLNLWIAVGLFGFGLIVLLFRKFIEDKISKVVGYMVELLWKAVAVLSLPVSFIVVGAMPKDELPGLIGALRIISLVIALGLFITVVIGDTGGFSPAGKLDVVSTKSARTGTPLGNGNDKGIHRFSMSFKDLGNQKDLTPRARNNQK